MVQRGTTLAGIRLPDGVRVSHETGMQPSGDLTAKATIWLKRSGWPKAVWRYKVRSPIFSCPDPYSGQIPGSAASACERRRRLVMRLD